MCAENDECVFWTLQEQATSNGNCILKKDLTGIRRGTSAHVEGWANLQCVQAKPRNPRNFDVMEGGKSAALTNDRNVDPAT